MGTPKYVVIFLVMALAGLLAAGQDKPTTPAQTSERRVSNTRFASCILKITLDPAIMPLSLENVEGLLQTSGVVYKADREVLSFTKPEDFARQLVTVEWLNASSAPVPPGARSSGQTGRGGPDEEMMRQMEQIYGADYVRQMYAGPDEQKKEEGAQTQAAQPAASPQDRPEMTAQRLLGESDVAYRVRLNQMRVKAQQETKARGTQSMGSMGGYGGGMMAGMGGSGGGMGGAGVGGMMGGYGRGGMGFYGAPAAGRQGASVPQSATVKLCVSLPEDVPPRADEFLGAVVTNLRESLRQAYESCRTDIDQMLVDAKMQYQFVESHLDSPTGAMPPATIKIRKQLDMYVDLSQLTGQTPLATAIDVLRKSVDPPLNIVVLWRDVQTNLSVDPASPINIDGSPKIRLGTALNLLAKGLYNGSATATWRIRDDAIVIGTAATLDPSQGAVGQSQVDADAVNLAGQRSELTRKVQSLELDLAGLEARWQKIVSEIPDIKKKVSERLLQDRAAQEMERLVQMYATKSTTTPEGRLVSPDSPEAQQNMIRARIELANRREELSKQAGGSQLDEFNKELTRIVIDQAEKRAQLKIVRTQLDEVQKQLAQALTFDPEVARLRMARETLDVTGHRVVELQTRMANLQPPTVTMIGAN